jgi:hypothetical protein
MAGSELGRQHRECGRAHLALNLTAIQVLRDLNAKDARNVPKDAPTGFVRRRWKPHVFRGDEIDRRFYELCVLSELRKRCVRATSGSWAAASFETSRSISYRRRPSRR